MAHWPHRIRVTATIDRMGCLHLNPASDRWRAVWAAHLETFGIDREGEALVFIQRDHEVERFMEDVVPLRHRNDLRNGWDVTFLMDPHEFGRGYVGWDAHTVVEAGLTSAAAVRAAA